MSKSNRPDPDESSIKDTIETCERIMDRNDEDDEAYWVASELKEGLEDRL